MMQAGAGLTVVGGEPTGSDRLVGLTVVGGRVWPGRFLSRERGKREGYLQATVNGQTILLPFVGAGGRSAAPIALAPTERLLFVGPRPSSMAIELRLIETNAATRKLLDRIETVADLATALPTAMLPRPADHGAQLVQALTQFLRRQARDTTEGILIAEHRQAWRDGADIRFTIANRNGVVAELDCRPIDLAPLAGDPIQIAVSVQRPRFEWTQDTIRIRKPARGPRGRAKTHALNPLDYLSQKGHRTFSFDIRSDRKKQTLSLPTAVVADGLSWQSLACFEVNRTGRAQNRLLIPLRIDAALTRPELPLKELDAIGDEFADFAKAAGTPLPAEADAIRRQLPTFLSQLADLTPHAISLASFDGVALLLPPGAQAPAGSGILPAQPDADGWHAEIRHPIIAPDGDAIGSFVCELRFCDLRKSPGTP